MALLFIPGIFAFRMKIQPNISLDSNMFLNGHRGIRRPSIYMGFRRLLIQRCEWNTKIFYFINAFNDSPVIKPLNKTHIIWMVFFSSNPSTWFWIYIAFIASLNSNEMILSLYRFWFCFCFWMKKKLNKKREENSVWTNGQRCYSMSSFNHSIRSFLLKSIKFF